MWQGCSYIKRCIQFFPLICWLQVDNREVTKFLSAVWRSLGEEEKKRDWGAMSNQDKAQFINIARAMTNSM